MGDRPVDLDGALLYGGVRFAFADGRFMLLEPGDVIVIVKNIEAFETRYDTSAMRLAGEYSGSLSNDGEEIILKNALGDRILRFTFADSWHPTTDGGGHSLVVVDAASDPAKWNT